MPDPAVCGTVACGHTETANAAAQILQDGGNAFDAIVAAHFAACVAEPVLASLGGGGFLLAHTQNGEESLYDFFAQTPGQRRPVTDCDFHPIHADFGTVTQEFHIGLGSVAVPGAVRGMFKIHEELCTLPMHQLMMPAIELARSGIQINEFQAYIFNIIKPILLASSSSRSIFSSADDPTSVKTENEILRLSEMANTMEQLALDGDALFYEGDIAEQIVQLSTDKGGLLSHDDLRHYAVIKRKPLQIPFSHSGKQARIVTNPAPSSGGTLIAFALKLLESADLDQYDFHSGQYLELLAEVMAMTNKARVDNHLVPQNNEQSRFALHNLLDPDCLHQYQAEIYQRSQCLRGTTHISVMDSRGNMASMTVSNGEGCGHIIPDTGIMLNNMLGEEDLNPSGFHRWPVSHRMTSMMAPSFVFLPGADDTRQRKIALGSGGSNRLRTAILQVLLNVCVHNLPLEQAVQHPRIHNENGLLSIEDGLAKTAVEHLQKQYSNCKLWDSRNLFFGGTHAVMFDGEAYYGTGDPRRGGVDITVTKQ